MLFEESRVSKNNLRPNCIRKDVGALSLGNAISGKKEGTLYSNGESEMETLGELQLRKITMTTINPISDFIPPLLLQKSCLRSAQQVGNYQKYESNNQPQDQSDHYPL